MNLLRPIYRPTAAYGHFGREDLGVPWELTDRVEALRADASATVRGEELARPGSRPPAVGRATQAAPWPGPQFACASTTP